MNNKYIFMLLFISTLAFSQNSKDYKIYQFEGNDSLNGHIAKIVRYNKNNQISFEQLIDFKISKAISISDYTDTFFYKDTLLIKKTTSNLESEDKSEIKYKYNSNNQLVQETYKNYERRLKPRTWKDGCIIDENDYRRRPNWKTISQIAHTYNQQGQLIESYSPKVHWDSQNRYLYEYDEKAKISKVISLEHNEIIWKETRINFENGYDYCRVWERDITPNDCKEMSHVKFVLNNQKKIIEYSKPDETGIRGNTLEKNFYDSDGTLIKKERFDTEGNIEVTHIYIKSPHFLKL